MFEVEVRSKSSASESESIVTDFCLDELSNFSWLLGWGSVTSIELIVPLDIGWNTDFLELTMLRLGFGFGFSCLFELFLPDPLLVLDCFEIVSGLPCEATDWNTDFVGLTMLRVGFGFTGSFELFLPDPFLELDCFGTVSDFTLPCEAGLAGFLLGSSISIVLPMRIMSCAR